MFCGIAALINKFDDCGETYYRDRDFFSVKKPDAQIDDVQLFLEGSVYHDDSSNSFNLPCDLLHDYLKIGDSFIKKLNGSFAIVILDNRDNSLRVYSDFLGTNTLFCYMKENAFILSSKLSDIIKLPFFDKGICFDNMTKFIYRQYMAPPKTIFKHVKKLEGGTYYVFKNKSCQEFIYWNVYSEYEKLSKQGPKTYQETLELSKSTMEKSISDRLPTTGNVLSFLSGGIDSTLISAMLQEKLGRTLDTYCIGFEDGNNDESRHAESVASLLKTNHHTLIMTDTDADSVYQQIIDTYDEPFADSSQIATSFLMKNIDKGSYAFAGDGSDEVFGGYPLYLKLRKFYFAKQFLGPFHMFSKLIDTKKLISLFPRHAQCLLLADTKNKYIQLECLDKQDIDKIILHPTDALLYDSKDMDDVARMRMLLDQTTYLYCSVVKVGYAARSNLIHLMSPFLDRNVIELSYCIDSNYLFKNDTNKAPLRDLLYNYLPKRAIEKPKHGFTIPLRKWMTELWLDDFRYFTDASRIKRQGIFNDFEVTKLADNLVEGRACQSFEISLCWSLLIFQRWYDKYIERI